MQKGERHPKKKAHPADRAGQASLVLWGGGERLLLKNAPLPRGSPPGAPRKVPAVLFPHSVPVREAIGRSLWREGLGKSEKDACASSAAVMVRSLLHLLPRDFPGEQRLAQGEHVVYHFCADGVEVVGAAG